MCVSALLIVACLGLPADESQAEPQQAGRDSPGASEAVRAVREKGIEWLTKNQAADGSWGRTYSVAVTSFACLSYLAASDEPFTGERGKALVRGLQYLMAKQQDGVFVQQGHTWIHVQGFGTLALSEAYGRSLFAKTKPDIDTDKIREIVAQSVRAIAQHQSNSGGWWYTVGEPSRHEGSTTVCAVQALVSASNFGIDIDKQVLARGFEYLKQCQNEDGGFDYQLGDTVSMKEGSAAGVATLGLMKKFDYLVMINGYKFLLKITPAGISVERFPYYGHFYGCMGMKLLGEEFKDFREQTDGYIAAAQKDVVSWQGEDGAWPVKGWMVGQETPAYSTAFATLVLSVREGRLSIFNRRPPKLPESENLEVRSKLDPPEIRLSGVARDAGRKQYTLTFEVSNPNSAAVSYLGYSPESFDPPLEKGMLIHRLEFKRDGKWQRYPLGWCGTGMAALELAPKSREMFGVAVMDDLAPNWEAVKFGISWAPCEKNDSPTAIPEMTAAWSKEITRQELDNFAPR